MSAWPACSILCALPGGDDSCLKRLSTLAKTDLLILDDFGLKPLTQAKRLYWN